MAKTTVRADVEELLDHVRREKDRVEEQLTNSDNRVRVLENDLDGLKAALKTSEDKKASLEKSLLNNAQEFAQRMDAKNGECRALEEEINRLKKEIEDVEAQTQAKETEKLEILHRFDNLRNEVIFYWHNQSIN
jgi:predicted  nucleic acid-binding Zn-ribbon protein